MKEFTLKSNFDDLDLSVMSETPEGELKGVLQIVHGMAEHKERYIDFMRFLAQHGYASVIHDHRGHGKSIKDSSSLGHMFDGGWEALVDDVRTVQNWAKAEFPGVDMFLFGHSMGSMVVRSFTKRYDDSIKALVVCGSPSDNSTKGLGKSIASLIASLRGEYYRSHLLDYLAIGVYNKDFKAEGKNAWLSVNKDNVAAYNEDEVCGFCFTANGFKNLMGLMQDCYSEDGWKVSNPDLPIHFISGGDDPCRVNDKEFAKAVDFLRQRGYRNVSSKLYPGLRHEILNEACAESVYEDIVNYPQTKDLWASGFVGGCLPK